MNINLKRQGYYREMPHAEETDPSIKDFIGAKIDNETRKRVCEYLNSGYVLVACYGTALDVINPDRGMAGCPSMMTDGVWVWPGDLAYYVCEYSLGLNAEFIEFMRKNHWKVSRIEDEIDYLNLTIDGKKLIE